MPDLTVVIPTYNRQELLRRTLAGYAKQSTRALKEVIVVDDGSTDGTKAVIEEAQQRSPFPVRYFYQPNQGPAAARNRGLEQVTTRLVLLTDDDMVPHPDLVTSHLDWHNRHPELSVAVLGFATWAPELDPTPFMRWYGEDGPLFAYGRFKKNSEISFWYFYSCNISLKREFLEKCGKFDERFKMAAYEDVELGFRLSRSGLRLLFNPQAVAYHHQRFTFEDACRRVQRAAAARECFLQTEAGKQFVRQGRNPSPRLRVVRQLAGRLFQPAVRWLDSPVRLPKVVYRSLFWYHAIRPAMSCEGGH
jgi:glycosyltransferase involved in cell wall biosynthesis